MYPEIEYAASSDVTPEFALRQLNTGEVLDRTFAVYRRRFAMFLGIALLPAVVSLVFGMAKVLTLRAEHLPAASPAFASIPLAIVAGLSIVCSLAATGLTAAASTFAIADVYLGEATSIAKSFRQAVKHWFRYALLSLVIILQASWLPAVCFVVLFVGLRLMSLAGSAGSPLLAGAITILFVLGALPWWFYRYAKVVLAMPASVMEDLRVIASIKRSKALTKERKWRIVLLFLIVGVLYLVVAMVAGVLVFAGLRARSQGVLLQMSPLLIAFFGNILLQPVFAIGVCLVYFDERVRQEGFDIEFMMRQTMGTDDPQFNSLPVDDLIGG